MLINQKKEKKEQNLIPAKLSKDFKKTLKQGINLDQRLWFKKIMDPKY
jgi:hypothetical protein